MTLYDGETEVLLVEREEFMNMLREYKIASEESLSKNKEDTTSTIQYEKKNIDNKYESVIEQHEDEIKRQKEDILKFQTTFTIMKHEIDDLRTENKELKVTKSESAKYSKSITATIETEKKESETQTDSTWKEVDSKDNTTAGKIKFQHIECIYFYKGKGCRRGESCWFSHSERKSQERVCHYWLEGRCRYSKKFSRSGKHKKLKKLYIIVS